MVEEPVRVAPGSTDSVATKAAHYYVAIKDAGTRETQQNVAGEYNIMELVADYVDVQTELDEADESEKGTTLSQD